MGKQLRKDGRKAEELRGVRLTRRYTTNAPGSALIEMGDTRALKLRGVK